MGMVGLEWQFSGFGDFSSGAGATDMIMRNANTGALQVYDIANNQITGASVLGTVGLDWQFAGVRRCMHPARPTWSCATPTPARSRSTTSPIIKSSAPRACAPLAPDTA